MHLCCPASWDPGQSPEMNSYAASKSPPENSSQKKIVPSCISGPLPPHAVPGATGPDNIARGETRPHHSQRLTDNTGKLCMLTLILVQLILCKLFFLVSQALHTIDFAGSLIGAFVTMETKKRPLKVLAVIALGKFS